MTTVTPVMLILCKYYYAHRWMVIQIYLFGLNFGNKTTLLLY